MKCENCNKKFPKLKYKEGDKVEFTWTKDMIIALRDNGVITGGYFVRDNNYLTKNFPDYEPVYTIFAEFQVSVPESNIKKI